MNIKILSEYISDDGNRIFILDLSLPINIFVEILYYEPNMRMNNFSVTSSRLDYNLYYPNGKDASEILDNMTALDRAKLDYILIEKLITN